jgi:TRAP-type C4-dicarboxylate transport system substrate-binding protein
MKKQAVLFLLTVLTAGAAVAAPSDAPHSTPAVSGVREIRFALIDHRKFGARYYVEAAKRFKKNVEAKTHGRLHVTLVDLADWGTVKREGAQVAIEEMAAGRLEMANLRGDTVARLYEPRLSVFDAPYLIQDYAQATRIVEGPVGRMLVERLPQHNLTSLAYTYSGGFRIVAGRRPLSASALAGTNVAMTNVPLEIEQYVAWGSHAVPTPKEDFMRVIDNGDAEAVEITWNCYDGTPGMKKKLPVVTELNNNFYVTLMLANSRFLDSLPADDRAAVVSSAQEAAQFERGVTLQGNAKIKEQLLRSGGSVSVISDEDRRALIRATQPVRDRFAKRVGQDVIDAVQAEARPTVSIRSIDESSLAAQR